MKVVTIDQVMTWKPCYPRAEIEVLFAERETITALDILAMPISSEDMLWAVLHEDLISPRTLRLFAVWCARQALALVAQPDPRSVAVCDVAERYADGKATFSQLAAAEGVAAEVRAAAQAVADTVPTAVWLAARGATDAAQAAERATEWNAEYAAPGAARAMARAVSWPGVDVKWTAVWDAARDAQAAQLRTMLASEPA